MTGHDSTIQIPGRSIIRIHAVFQLPKNPPKITLNLNFQLNKNSFGLVPGQPLNVPSIPANQSVDVSLPLAITGPVQRMEPLTNLQVKYIL